jgi:pimeloyl-ACP methyl ester carboxylesterase
MSGGLALREQPGAGEAVLWLHGYTMDSRIWAEAWALLPGPRHLGLDLPGHGGSPPAPALDLPALGRRVAEVARAEGARHLVGLSFGGMVALQAAIEAPDAFDTLTLGAPALGGGPQDRAVQARNLALGELHRERGPGPWLAELWMRPPSRIFAGAARDPALLARLAAIIAGHAWTELADGSVSRLALHPQAAELARVAADTLVLIGEEDSEAFRRSAELIRRGVPRCRRVHLPATSHLTLLERAAALPALLDAQFRRPAAPAPEGGNSHGGKR